MFEVMFEGSRLSSREGGRPARTTTEDARKAMR